MRAAPSCLSPSPPLDRATSIWGRVIASQAPANPHAFSLLCPVANGCPHAQQASARETAKGHPPSSSFQTEPKPLFRWRTSADQRPKRRKAKLRPRPRRRRAAASPVSVHDPSPPAAATTVVTGYSSLQRMPSCWPLHSVKVMLGFVRVSAADRADWPACSLRASEPCCG